MRREIRNKSNRSFLSVLVCDELEKTVVDVEVL